MIKNKKICCILLFFVFFQNFANPQSNPLLQKGWQALIKDNENEAFKYFWQANKDAISNKNFADEAESLLYLGICSYGSSHENGLLYATQSLNCFKKLEKTDAKAAINGRIRCLQLISTIYGRQNKFNEAKKLSYTVVNELINSNDKTGTLGLAYNSLGTIYNIQKKQDSSDYCFKMALNDFEKYNLKSYLPTSYLKISDIFKRKNQLKLGFEYLEKAIKIANETENKQAQVQCYMAFGNWNLTVKNNEIEAENNFNFANKIAQNLSDKTFEINTLERLIVLKNKQNKYKEINNLQRKIIEIKDNYYSLEKEQITKNLEVQFEMSEKDDKLELLSNQKAVSRLTIYLLFSLLLLLIGAIFFYKRINKRDKLLLKTKEELVAVLENQEKIKQQQFENDIDHKENQLSAITLQMLQKNELLEEIKQIIAKKEPTTEAQLSKIVNQHFSQGNNWKDFDKYFESINKHFYTKLKQQFPEISGNDLKICALIKLNLSIKEMAIILNISPDSVKTARHRLRKKLHLKNEENLTDFILNI